MIAEMSLPRLIAAPVLALSRRSNRFFETAFFRSPPPVTWTTPNSVFAEDEILRLRKFSLVDDGSTERESTHRKHGSSGYPVLVVPPEVNQSVVVDFGPGQSLVAALLEAGFADVYAIEWLHPTPATASRGIDSSVAGILDCIERIGGNVHLIGICQGGWESTIAAALRPSEVATLTLVAAPVDFSAGEGMVKQMARITPMAVYRSLVAAGGGVMRGDVISNGFDNLMLFERTWLKHLSLWNHLYDRAWLDRYLQLNDWYRSPKNLPGPLYLRVVRELFKENRLVRGTFLCLGRLVDLTVIACPLCLIAGRRDHITPPRQVWATREALSSSDVLEIETKGGHIGAFMGRTELQENWPVAFEWLHRKELELLADFSEKEPIDR